MKNTFYLLTFASLLFAGACKKDQPDCPPDEIYSLTELVLEDFKHLGYDSIVFAHKHSAKADTVVFTGKGSRVDTMFIEDRYSGNCQVGYWGQRYKAEYEAKNYPHNLKIELTAEVQGSVKYKITLEKKQFLGFVELIGNSNWGNVVNNMEINGKDYWWVSRREIPNKNFLYINKVDGILKIITSDSTEFFDRIK